jgi:hypothetical protein
VRFGGECNWFRIISSINDVYFPGYVILVIPTEMLKSQVRENNIYFLNLKYFGPTVPYNLVNSIQTYGNRSRCYFRSSRMVGTPYFFTINYQKLVYKRIVDMKPCYKYDVHSFDLTAERKMEGVDEKEQIMYE